MKMKKCKECLVEIPVKAKRCSHCSAKQPKEVGVLGYILVGLLVIALAPIFFAGKENTAPISPERSAQNLSENKASTACMVAIKKAAKFPSSVDFHIFSRSYQHYTDGSVRFFINLEAKNGIGNMLPMRGVCKWSNGVVSDVSMLSR